VSRKKRRRGRPPQPPPPAPPVEAPQVYPRGHGGPRPDEPPPPPPFSDQDVAFVQAIAETPDDDTPRLVYADWLDEHGDPQRAELIRVQCELVRAGVITYARQTELQARERELLLVCQARWRGRTGLDLSYATWRRGFIDEVSLTPEQLLSHSELFRTMPVRALTLQTDYGLDLTEQTGRLAACPHLERVRRLELQRWPARELTAFLSSPHLGRLRELKFQHAAVDAERALALAAVPALARLEELDLAECTAGVNGLRALLAATPALTRLDVSGYHDPGSTGGYWDWSGATDPSTRPNVGRDGAKLLASWPGSARLRLLDLSKNELDAAACDALIASPHLGGLEVLRLGEMTSSPFGQRRPALQAHFGSRLSIVWPSV
jgi:uncharacterized protein (TIGR02996 family)